MNFDEASLAGVVLISFEQVMTRENFLHGTDAARNLQITEFYAPGANAGLRYDDPMTGIDWPTAVNVVSGKDAAWLLV